MTGSNRAGLKAVRAVLWQRAAGLKGLRTVSKNQLSGIILIRLNADGFCHQITIFVTNVFLNAKLLLSITFVI